MQGIYKVTNKINGKIYIGQSVNIEDRWRNHKFKPFYEKSGQYNSLFYKAIRKYGIENFIFEVVEECKKEELDEKEKYWIKYYDSNNLEKGYNLTDGGESQTFSILTQEQVNQIYELLKETNKSQEEIGKMFGVNQRTISAINTGHNWNIPEQDYPIRKFNITAASNKQYYCSKCGIARNYESDSNLCRKCYLEESKKEKGYPSREELKDLIRTTPFVKIGKQYGVTDNAVRRWCQAENLPYRSKDIKLYSDEEWQKL